MTAPHFLLQCKGKFASLLVKPMRLAIQLKPWDCKHCPAEQGHRDRGVQDANMSDDEWLNYDPEESEYESVDPEDEIAHATECVLFFRTYPEVEDWERNNRSLAFSKRPCVGGYEIRLRDTLQWIRKQSDGEYYLDDPNYWFFVVGPAKTHEQFSDFPDYTPPSDANFRIKSAPARYRPEAQSSNLIEISPSASGLAGDVLTAFCRNLGRARLGCYPVILEAGEARAFVQKFTPVNRYRPPRRTIFRQQLEQPKEPKPAFYLPRPELLYLCEHIDDRLTLIVGSDRTALIGLTNRSGDI